MLVLYFFSLFTFLKFLNTIFDNRIDFFIAPIEKSVCNWVVSCSSRRVKFTTKSISIFLSAYFIFLYVFIMFFCLIFDSDNETFEKLIFEFFLIFWLTFLGFKTKDEFVAMNKSFFYQCSKKISPVILCLNVFVIAICSIANSSVLNLDNYSIMHIIVDFNLIMLLVLVVIYAFLIPLPYLISFCVSYLIKLFFAFSQKKAASPFQTFYGFLFLLSGAICVIANL